MAAELRVTTRGRSRTREDREEPEKAADLRVMTRGRSRTREDREEPEKAAKLRVMTRGRSRTREDRGEPEKAAKLRVMTRRRSRTREDRGEPEKAAKLSPMTRSRSTRRRSRSGEDPEEPEKKPRVSMDPVISVDSCKKGASERIPGTVVCFRYRPPDLHRFEPKLAEFGRILSGPFNLPFLHDFAYVHYFTQDAADKALQQPIKIPKLGEEIICRNIDDTALDAVRQAAYNLVEAHVLRHPTNTLVYVNNVHYEATLDQLRVFFSRFGEIAEVPIWFEMEPESEFGFALIVYQTEEGAKEAVQQPYNHFGGHQVHCSRDLEAIAKFYQEMLVDYLEGFAQFFLWQQSLLLQQAPPLAGAHI